MNVEKGPRFPLSLKLGFLAAAVVIISSATGWGARSSTGYRRILQGPMVGAVSPESITIWVRLNGSFPCSLEVAADSGFEDPLISQKRATDDQDYTLRLSMTGLEPDTTYFYRVKVDGKLDRYQRGQPPYRARTAPLPTDTTQFSVGFGSCARYSLDPVQRVWSVAERSDLDLFFWVGDNIYGDSPDPSFLAEEWRRQRDVANLQPFLRGVPQLAIWDDHDFGLNDHDRTHPRKAEALTVFKNYWANPSYGLPDAPGVFFHYAYGGIDFFFLDCRYYRDPNHEPDSPSKTMLGARQLAWLKDELEASHAPFKVLVSSSGWSSGKGHGGDAWSSFLHERNALFDFIRDRRIQGVILVSGDTHRGEANAIPWSERGGYDLYEFVSSPLAQRPNPPNPMLKPEVRIRPLFTIEPQFGVLQFNLGDDPTVSFNLIGVSQRRAWDPVVVHASELVNGIESWTGKQRL